MSTLTLFQSAALSFSAGSRVDKTAGIIYGVSVITEGPARGHGVMIDQTTLAQMKRGAESYSGGLKVKISTGKAHRGDFAEIVGTLQGFRIADSKLVADLHLLDNAEDRAFVLEVAEKMPDAFGLSVAFSGISEERAGVRYARCSEIYSADLVGEPAANPDGLFSRRFDEWTKTKGHSPDSKHMENELLSQIGKMVDEKLAAVSANFDKQLSDLKTANATALSKIEEVSKLSAEAADKAAFAAVKEFSKTLGQPAGNAAAPSAPPAPPVVKKFEDLVREHSEYAKSKTTAITSTMRDHPAAYQEYMHRLQSRGEVIMF